MSKILNNNFNNELITIAIRPDLGHHALISKCVRDDISLNKKVLYFSLELNKELMTKRIGIENNDNLLVVDNPIKDLNDMVDIINEFSPNLIVVDYLHLLPNADEAIKLLKNVSIDKNIPIIVFSYISDSLNKELDFTTLSLEEFITYNSKLELVIEESDKFVVLYHKKDKEYMYKELKNIYGETQEIDIRELLN